MTKQDNKTEIESNASSAVNQLPYQMKDGQPRLWKLQDGFQLAISKGIQQLEVKLNVQVVIK
jgi:hypothetical protein